MKPEFLQDADQGGDTAISRLSDHEEGANCLDRYRQGKWSFDNVGDQLRITEVGGISSSKLLHDVNRYASEAITIVS